MNYYSKRLFLAPVNKDDKILGKIERWQAHEKGILHRGFTAVLKYDHQIILQRRKHPAFDKFYDLTFSSHPVYINNVLQSMEEAIYETLKREWNLEKKDLLGDLKYLGKFYYQARDPNSIYSEHEIDYVYSTTLKKLPTPNPDFAYGFKLINKIGNWKLAIGNFKMAPWVEKILEKKFI